MYKNILLSLSNMQEFDFPRDSTAKEFYHKNLTNDSQHYLKIDCVKDFNAFLCNLENSAIHKTEHARRQLNN